MSDNINFSKETAEEYKKKIKELNITEHYIGADNSIEVANLDVIYDLIKNPKILKLEENGDALLYKSDNDE